MDIRKQIEEIIGVDNFCRQYGCKEPHASTVDQLVALVESEKKRAYKAVKFCLPARKGRPINWDNENAPIGYAPHPTDYVAKGFNDAISQIESKLEDLASKV